jgi:hypothetical protein
MPFLPDVPQFELLPKLLIFIKISWPQDFKYNFLDRFPIFNAIQFRMGEPGVTNEGFPIWQNIEENPKKHFCVKF